jgi:hypothetical protein
MVIFVTQFAPRQKLPFFARSDFIPTAGFQSLVEKPVENRLRSGINLSCYQWLGQIALM